MTLRLAPSGGSLRVNGAPGWLALLVACGSSGDGGAGGGGGVAAAHAIHATMEAAATVTAPWRGALPPVATLTIGGHTSPQLRLRPARPAGRASPTGSSPSRRARR